MAVRRVALVAALVVATAQDIALRRLEGGDDPCVVLDASGVGAGAVAYEVRDLDGAVVATGDLSSTTQHSNTVCLSAETYRVSVVGDVCLNDDLLCLEPSAAPSPEPTSVPTSLPTPAPSPRPTAFRPSAAPTPASEAPTMTRLTFAVTKRLDAFSFARGV